MKKIMILVIIISASILTAIDYRQASGQNVAITGRDSIFAYHTGIDDHHWFGSDSWAVKFEFNNYTAVFDTLFYNAEGAYIYFPGSGGNDFTVSVCRDSIGQPGFSADYLYFTDNYINSNGWNQITFSETISDTILWLVVDYETNPENMFISGSANDGTHSYFKYNDYYYSLFSYSYESEFLFSLYGSFEVDGIDLELITVNWNSNGFFTGAFISPEFVIRNNSNSNASGAYLDFSLSDPLESLQFTNLTSGAVYDSLLLPDIPAGHTLHFDVSDSLFYELNRDPSQYKYLLNLVFAADPLNANNSYLFEFDTFNLSMEYIMAENFLIPNESSSNAILQIQEDLFENQNVQKINYFSDQSFQPFFCNDASLRFSYYSLMGNPATIINGDKKIIGYITSLYEPQLSGLVNIAQTQDSTFIISSTASGTYNDDQEVIFDFELRNYESYLFGSFLADCTVYAAVVEDLVDYPGFPANVSVLVLRKIIASFTDPDLNADEIFTETVSFNRAVDYETITSYENCKIVYWLQNDETKRIYHTGFLSFNDLEQTDIQNDQISKENEQIQIFPNPYSLQGDLKISFQLIDTWQKATLKIYNIKGQLVRTLQKQAPVENQIFFWNGRDQNNKETASGIYLMKLETSFGGKSTEFTKKLLLIKN